MPYFVVIIQTILICFPHGKADSIKFGPAFFLAVGYVMRVSLSQQSLCEAVKIPELWEWGEIKRKETTNAAMSLFYFLSLPFLI